MNIFLNPLVCPFFSLYFSLFSSGQSIKPGQFFPNMPTQSVSLFIPSKEPGPGVASLNWIFCMNDWLSGFAQVLFFLSVAIRLLTSTAGVHQMRLLHRHSLYHCLRCHLMTFYPQKRPYSSFENNAGQTDLRTDGRTYGPTDGRTRPLIEMRSRI